MAGRSTTVRNVALVVIVVITAFVLASVLGLGGSDGSSDERSTVASTTPGSPSGETSVVTSTATPTIAPGLVIPDDDYTAVCGLLQAPVTAYQANPGVAGFTAMFEALDFDALVAASNDWLRPGVEALRDQHEDVVASIAGLQEPAEIAAALSPEFSDGLEQLTAVAIEKCGIAPI